MAGGSPVRFTPRQLEVLGRLLAGDNEKQVARALGISAHTVHTHVKEVYRRLEVNTRGELFTKLFAAIIANIRGGAPPLAVKPRAAGESNGNPSAHPRKTRPSKSPTSLPPATTPTGF